MLDPEEEHAYQPPTNEEHVISDEDHQDDEMYEYHRFTADPGQSPLRVDKFLINKLEGTTRSRIQS